jgi:hypothetical protein
MDKQQTDKERIHEIIRTSYNAISNRVPQLMDGEVFRIPANAVPPRGNKNLKYAIEITCKSRPFARREGDPREVWYEFYGRLMGETVLLRHNCPLGEGDMKRMCPHLLEFDRAKLNRRVQSDQL